MYQFYMDDGHQTEMFNFGCSVEAKSEIWGNSNLILELYHKMTSMVSVVLLSLSQYRAHEINGKTMEKEEKRRNENCQVE